MRNIVILLAAICFSGSALADKPSWAGNGKQSKKDEYQQGESKHGDHHESGGSYRFNDDSRQLIGSYYGEQARA